MGKTSFNRLNHKIKSWRIGDYFRQFSIVAAGIIVTFWGNDRITENARQKEVRATMQLVTEELEYNRQELRNIKHLLDIDIHMSLLLREHDMDVSKIPTDTLWKYGKFFNNMDEFSYRTDALDVLKGSSLMQYIPDKRMLQDVLQTYFELGRKQKGGLYEKDKKNPSKSAPDKKYCRKLRGYQRNSRRPSCQRKIILTITCAPTCLFRFFTNKSRPIINS